MERRDSKPVRFEPLEARRLVVVSAQEFHKPVESLDSLDGAIVWVRPPAGTEAAAVAEWKRQARAAGAVRVQDLPPEAGAAELPERDVERVAGAVDVEAALDLRGVVADLLARARERSAVDVDWHEVERVIEHALAGAGL